MKNHEIIEILNDIIYSLSSINSNICVNFLKPKKQITNTQLNIIERNININIKNIIELKSLLTKQTMEKL